MQILVINRVKVRTPIRNFSGSTPPPGGLELVHHLNLIFAVPFTSCHLSHFSSHSSKLELLQVCWDLPLSFTFTVGFTVAPSLLATCALIVGPVQPKLIVLYPLSFAACLALLHSFSLWFLQGQQIPRMFLRVLFRNTCNFCFSIVAEILLRARNQAD